MNLTLSVYWEGQKVLLSFNMKKRLELIKENEKLKEQRLSSSRFRNKQKKLYIKSNMKNAP